MALIKCPDCGKMFSEHAICCPVCGCPTKDAKAEMRVTGCQQKDDKLLNSQQQDAENNSCANCDSGGDSYDKSETMEPQSTKKKSWIKWVGISSAIILLALAPFFIWLYSSSKDIIRAEVMEKMFVDLNERLIIKENVPDKYKCFVVISKKEHSLKVYEALDNDTSLVAVFPACLSKNYGQKQEEGDMRTPESSMRYPFTICQIHNSSKWKYDFGDGRGKIRAYGNWFLRLATGFDGIGIQGSTNNASSVPGRASSGSVRLRDEDVIYLKEYYAFIGMKVVIKQEEEGLFAFERKSLEHLNVDVDDNNEVISVEGKKMHYATSVYQ